MQYEYKVVPAPTRGKKARGLKTPADRFANALSQEMNSHAADGWEYLRTDTLPAEVRSGLTGRSTVFQNMLVFRRAAEVELASVAAEVETEAKAAPAVDVSTIAETHAPKLPGANDAQAVPDAPANTVYPRGLRGDVAAQ